MALTESPPEIDTAHAVDDPFHETPRSTEPTALERVVGSGDHRLLGRILIGASLVFLVANLLVSALVDLDVATDAGLFQADVTERLLINHQLGLLLLGALPLLLGLAFCVVPAQVGSPAIAFPRAAAAAVWTWLGSAIVFVVAVAANGGYGGGNTDVARLGNLATGALIVALLLGVVCVAVTVLALRPAGMGLADVPFFSFSMLVTATIWVLTLPAALAHIAVAQGARYTGEQLLGTTFTDGIAWLVVQPAVFLVLIPVLGIVVDVAATAVGGRQRFRGAVQSLIGFFGVLSFGAWAQRPEARETIVWVAVTLAAGLPLIGILGAVADTLRQGRPKLMSPLVFGALAMLVALLGAGVGLVQTINTFGSGELAGFGAADLVTAQFRLVLGAAVVGALGGVFYWGRQVTGSPIPDGPAKGLAPLAALAVVVWGAPWLIQGLATTDSPELFAGIAAAGGALLGLAVLGTFGAMAQSTATSARGDELLADAWGGGGTLEWSDPSVEPVTVESPYPVLDAAGKDAS